MKTLSTDIKKGQVIKYGNLWGVALEDAKPSNIKNHVSVDVKILRQTVKHRGGYKKTYEGGYTDIYVYRNTTQVKTK